MIVSSVSKGQKGRTLHFVRYLPDRMSSVYRRTADPSHAVLTVGWIPAHVSDRSVEIAVNLTVFAGPFGVRNVVHYAEIGRNRLVYLFAP
ncbi:MAG: hypothetical protein ABWY07_00125 [Burkholderiales bacterium]